MEDRHQIFTAVENGDVNYINQLPQNSWKVNVTDSMRGSPLIEAIVTLWFRDSSIQQKYLNIAKMLINKGCDVNITNNSNQTALHYSVIWGDSDIVQLLLDHGAECDATDRSGRTPLLLAVEKGNINIAKILINRGCDLNIRDKEGQTALHIATKNGYIDIAKMLINSGCDVNILDKYKPTALHIATEHTYIDIVQLLLDHDANMDAPYINGRAPLLMAVDKGNIDIAKMLINRGCDVSIQDRNGQTALHYLATHSFIYRVPELINSGCDVNIQDKDGQTAKHSYIDIVKLLIDHQADLHVGDSHMKTPLMCAVRKGDIAVVQMLIDAGSDVNALDINNITSLYHSIRLFCYYRQPSSNYKRYFPIIKLLLNSGADPNIGASTIENILTHYFGFENLRLLRLLFLHGFNRDMYPIVHRFLTDEESVITPENLKLMDFICLIGACPQSRLFSLYKDLDRTEILKDDTSKREWLKTRISVPMSLQNITRKTIFKILRLNKLKKYRKIKYPDHYTKICKI